MPHERMRSLRWGWELLQALQSDSSIPLVLAARAETLAQTYPTPEMLIQMLRTDQLQFPEGFAESVDGARTLFEEVQFGRHGSRETRRHALFTLRHFPLKGTAVGAQSAAWQDGFENWLAPEDSSQ